MVWKELIFSVHPDRYDLVRHKPETGQHPQGKSSVWARMHISSDTKLYFIQTDWLPTQTYSDEILRSFIFEKNIHMDGIVGLYLGGASGRLEQGLGNRIIL